MGCQSRLRTVERMGFFICLHTHLSSSCSNKGGDDARTTAPHRQLVLTGGPAHTASGSVDLQDDQRGYPRGALQHPQKGIAVCAAGHNTVTLRGPVDDCHLPIVPIRLVNIVLFGTNSSHRCAPRGCWGRWHQCMVLVPGISRDGHHQEAVVSSGSPGHRLWTVDAPNCL